ncbi:hypothetical protein KSF_086860 [Reticulibacter mediterranei]|uniref:DUF3102 domain-containing protein n=1 Tax=Reticulibacter mediterranei TaxID=2778369 RepID=A0A8J3IU63_9CHLR|nr:hypothetical protein [Reticulibacter mediterranei]GHO98638.1 hypothetical protein KSF_086860 [Reticulibacter mediterranei]
MSEQRWEEDQTHQGETPEPYEVVTFDYSALDEETRIFVQQKTEETHVYLKRTTETIVQIGHNLLTVQQRLGHGRFMAWLQAEFAMNYYTAHNCMLVASRFGDKFRNFQNFPASVLYLLAQPSISENIIAQVEAGHLAPTLGAIKAAKQAEHAANVQAKQQAQSNTPDEQEQTQERVLHHQHEPDVPPQHEAPPLMQQAEPRTIIKEVVPKATEVELAALREKLRRLSQERDALSKQAEEQARHAQAAALQEEERPTAHMNAQWQRRTQEALQILSQLLIGWPSPLDADHFGHDDWKRLSQVEEAVNRLQHACAQLRETRDRTVSADIPTNETGEDNGP